MENNCSNNLKRAALRTPGWLSIKLFDFSSGHDLTVQEFESALGELEPGFRVSQTLSVCLSLPPSLSLSVPRGILSLALSPPSLTCTLPLSLSLSQKIKINITKIKRAALSHSAPAKYSHVGKARSPGLLEKAENII